VANLRQQASIIFAKTGMTELATDAVGPTPMPANYNSNRPVRLNPYDPAAIPVPVHRRPGRPGTGGALGHDTAASFWAGNVGPDLGVAPQSAPTRRSGRLQADVGRISRLALSRLRPIRYGRTVAKSVADSRDARRPGKARPPILTIRDDPFCASARGD